MARNDNFSVVVDSITLTKFNGSEMIDLRPQMAEISFFQSIFSPVIKCDLVIVEAIGLFVNFPLTGEEVIDISYRTDVAPDGVGGNKVDHQFVIDAVTDIMPSDKAREVAFKLELIGVEALANATQLVSHAYNGLITKSISDIFDEYISKKTTKLIPSYKTKKLQVDQASDSTRTIVVPRLHPFKAMSWLSTYAVAPDTDKHTYVFFQTNNGFRLSTLQNLTNWSQRETVVDKRLRYFSDEKLGSKDALKDSSTNFTPISNLVNNKRYSTLEKISSGYFQNGQLEINLLQKSYEMTSVTNDDINTITSKPLNTKGYQDAVRLKGGTMEELNRVHYSYNNRKDQVDENPQPLETFRKKWGLSTAHNLAFSQIDYHATIAGDMEIEAGQMIYCEIPEMHGFNVINKDEIISGRFLITEVKQIVSHGGIHSTVLRLNKDSYEIEVDFPKKYQ